MITKSPIPRKAPIPPVIKLRVVARLLSVSRNTVRSLIDNGDLEAFDVNHFKKKQRLHRRVTRESLLTFYKKRFGHPLERALINPFETESSTKN